MANKQNWEIMYEKYKKQTFLTEEEINGKNEQREAEYRKRLSEITDTNSNEYKQLIKERNQSRKEYKAEISEAKNFDIIKENLEKNESILLKIKKTEI